MNPFRILFVCTANQCRSVMADAFARRELASRPSSPFLVSSTGTYAVAGIAATAETVQVVAERGAGAEHHRSRPAEASTFADADLMLTMTRRHLSTVRILGEDTERRSALLATFARVAADAPSATLEELVTLASAADPRPEDDVEDPVGQDLETHRRCAERIDQLVVATVDALGARFSVPS